MSEPKAERRARPATKMMRELLLAGASALALTAGAAPAFAQDNSATANSSSEEVVVTGIRGSLQRSLDIKRNSVGVVDAISSEDIGKFPDSNLGAAIQRIPGVSISHGATSMGGVPTSSGDATQITVRGFGPSFNETLFDGRYVSIGANNNPSTGNSRGFDFSAVGADFVGQVDIMKTPDATLSSGAIGATINIKFPKPFDHPGLRVAGSISGAYSPDEGDTSPNGGFLISDTFNNNTFGILVDANYSDHKVRGNHVNVQGWEGTYLDPCQLQGGGACAATLTPDTSHPTWFIQDYGIYQEHTEDKRVDGRVVLQWRPRSDLTLTLNDNYSRDELSQTQYGYSVWFNAGSLRNVTRNSDGTITNFVQNNTPTDFQSQVNSSILENNEVGFNARWDASDNLNFEFDVDHAVSKLNPGDELSSIDMDVGYGPSPNGTNGTNVGVVVGGSNDLPYVTGIGPNGNAARFLDVSLLGSHVLPISSARNEDTVDQVKLQGNWSNGDLTLRFGGQYVDDQKQFRSFDSFANNDWQAYSGYGPNSNNPTGVDLPDNFFHPFSIGSGFISGFGNNGRLVPGLLQYDPFAVKAYLESLGNPQATVIPGQNTGCCNPAFDGVYRIIENVGSHQDIEEKTTALFVSLTNHTELANMPLVFNAGVRVERTNLESVGVGQLPTSLTVQTGDATAFNVAYGPRSNVSRSNEYTYVLPNFDLNLSLTDNLKLRFDASRTLTRAPLNLITPVLNIPGTQRVGSLVATGGNPDLLPFLSDNLDVGLEWYYAPNSYLSGDVFVKEVTNFIVGGSTRQTINGVIDPTTGQPAQFTVTTNINGPSAEVRGVELAVQHVFGDTGFGVQANATFVDTDKPFNSNDISRSGFAVTGLANSANVVGFYEKYGFEARVALNWRDEYLDHFGQTQNNSGFGTEPTFVNAGTYVDFSSSYQINEHLQVYFEGLNLTDETFSTHGRFGEQILDAVDTGRRFTLGARYRM